MGNIKAFLGKTERVNLFMGIACLVIGFFVCGADSFVWEADKTWFSLLIGVLSSLLNLRVIGILASRLISQGGVAVPLGIFLGKFALLLAICYVVVVVVKVDVIAFVTGLSTAYLSLVIVAVIGAEDAGNQETQE